MSKFWNLEFTFLTDTVIQISSTHKYIFRQTLMSLLHYRLHTCKCLSPNASSCNLLSWHLSWILALSVVDCWNSSNLLGKKHIVSGDNTVVRIAAQTACAYTACNLWPLCHLSVRQTPLPRNCTCNKRDQNNNYHKHSMTLKFTMTNGWHRSHLHTQVAHKSLSSRIFNHAVLLKARWA